MLSNLMCKSFKEIAFHNQANMQSQAILRESLNYCASLTITAFAFKTDSNNFYTALQYSPCVNPFPLLICFVPILL